MHFTRIVSTVSLAALLGAILLGMPHIGAPASGPIAPGMPQDAHGQPEDEVRIGILMPLTGDLSAIGLQMHYAARMAVAEFNEYLTERNMEWRLVAIYKDTGSSPETALGLVQDLHFRDVDIMVGPAGSVQLFGVLAYLNHNGMVAISPASTSPALAVPDDAAFRTVPDDHNQGKAFAALFAYSGVEAVVPISPNDSYQTDLVDATAEIFEARGGTTYDAILYDPGSGDYSADAARLADAVYAAIDVHGAANTAVLVMSYDGAAPILKAAASHDVLSQVRWFGGEVIAQSTEISADPDASEFATTTDLTAVSLLLATSAKADSVDERISALFGDVRTQFVYSAYDAVWLVGLSVMQTGGTNATGIRAALPGVAESYSGGALESVELNEAGDLMRADYEIWTHNQGGWVRGATYDGRSDSIVAAGGAPAADEASASPPHSYAGASDGAVLGATFHWSNGTLALEFADTPLYVDVSAVRIIDGRCAVQFARVQWLAGESGRTSIVINTTEYQRNSLAGMYDPFVMVLEDGFSTGDGDAVPYSEIPLYESGEKPHGMHPCTITYGSNELLLDVYTPDPPAYMHAMHAAFESWSDLNPEVRFVWVERDPVVHIEWVGHHPEYMGLACIWCVGYDAVMEIVAYEHDCTGARIPYTPQTIQDTVAHEIGHVLGLEHHADETHLMYGSDFIQDPFDTLGYSIPERLPNLFVGEAELLDDLDDLDAQLAVMNEDLNALDAEMDQFVSKRGDVVGNTIYFDTQSEVNKYQGMLDEYNALVESYNAVVGEYNAVSDTLNCMYDDNAPWH